MVELLKMIIKPDIIIYDGNEEKYKVLKFIGSGAFGNIYKIEKFDNKTIWALKTLPESFQDGSVLKGLINEGDLATKISHINVIKYIYFHDGSLFNELPPYIIMEFANQGTLKNIIENQRSSGKFLENNELIGYFSQLTDGMEAINTRLIHRDIKPDNILVKDDLLKISDFGLSKIVQAQTRTSTFKGFGHIKYMSPEGWDNKKNTIQMDIYSMGIVFFELATLIHPLEISSVNGDEIQHWRNAHFFQHPKNPEDVNTSISPMLSQIILKMLEKSVDKRFKSWHEISDKLRKERLFKVSNMSLVKNILRKRLEKDDKEKTEQLKKQKRTEEINEFKKVVKYQLENDVLMPIKEFVEEFNKQYLDGDIRITDKGECKYIIELVSGQLLILDIEALLDEDFIRTKIIDDYGMTLPITKLERPMVYNRKIMAWGYLNNQLGQGFNILLVEKEGEIYGEWFVLINTNSALSSTPRNPEPFSFDLHELEKEIGYINVTHIYNMKVESLRLEHFTKFIEEGI